MIQATLGFASDLGERSGAWDEVYYSPEADLGSAITAWTATSGLLGLARTSRVGRRLQCLSDQCFLYYARFAVVGVRGASRVLHGNQFGFRGSENFAGDAVVTRVHSQDYGFHREIRLGGLPDNAVTGNAVDIGFYKSYVSSVIFDQVNPDTFIGRLITDGCLIRGRTSSIGGPSSWQITGASKPDQFGPITLTTSRGAAFDPTIPVTISMRGQPQVSKGKWKVQPSTPIGSITLVGSERVSLPATITGFVTLGIFDGVPIKNWDAPFLSAHKLGKKKYQRRGRQSPTLLRH